MFLLQVGFGLYPVIVKKFATGEKADPLVLSFYRWLFIYAYLDLTLSLVMILGVGSAVSY